MKIRPEPAIYKFQNVISGDSYIGCTRNARNRKNDHYLDLKKNKHRNPKLQEDFNRLEGNTSSFEFVVLEYFPIGTPDNELIRREQEWMDFLRPFYNSRRALPKFGHDLDLEKERFLSTRKGRKQTQEEKKRRGESIRAYWAKNPPKKISDEHRRAISEKMSGEKHHNWGKKTPENVRNKISNAVSSVLYTFYNPNKEEVSFRNLKRFCEENNLSETCLREVMRGRRKHHKGWVFVEKINLPK
jgi:group I intron endonuclease